ncbi:hypothetical protein [Candidatus Villigracilis affinis]|uniref:hypothetical protein n=1 Tax=Candidatus Villigracilis affinis TaxID=3140682 RepID=UPI001DA76F32|nr:hypothetical protein [Anaerolineales bacterium]
MLVHASFLVNAGYGVIHDRPARSWQQRRRHIHLRPARSRAMLQARWITCSAAWMSTGAKIGALGISLGAQAALRGALKTDKIRALVLDGLSPARLSDHGGSPRSIQRWLNLPFNWLYYRMYEYMIRGRDAGVLEVIGRIAPRPILLIASGSKDIYFSRLFYEAAKDPRERWEIQTGFTVWRLLATRRNILIAWSAFQPNPAVTCPPNAAQRTANPVFMSSLPWNSQMLATASSIT